MCFAGGKSPGHPHNYPELLRQFSHTSYDFQDVCSPCKFMVKDDAQVFVFVHFVNCVGCSGAIRVGLY